ncbi:Protein fantastic four 1 [Apostasia shenzhenica]|uniref:Protein fantastic four 1 n=1 Tax=Apostasia shenzhenica TaxID=1088818 RepID=A0A2I0AH57_9ASPA|nr:Protein fantastic four 1 [Apostasia shenzhenica]
MLGFPDSDDRRNPLRRRSHLLLFPDASGLQLLATDQPNPPYLLETPAVGYPAGGQNPADPGPGAWGLHEAAPAGGDGRGIGLGLGLCTEGLGCESCDGGTEIEDDGGAPASAELRRQPARRRREEVRFPPPLRWLTGSGGRRWSRFMKAERRDGRLVLREFEISPPPEIFRASRRDGRLRLQLVGKQGEDY